MMDVGSVGVWSLDLRVTVGPDADEIADAAAELDELGYGAVWIPGGLDADDFTNAAWLLGATSDMVVATGILNIWLHDARTVATRQAELLAKYPDRFLVGLGVSHRELIDTIPPGPLAAMSRFLDEMDSADSTMRPGDRVLAALGPRMTQLSRTRAGGAHPFLVTTEHVRAARTALGTGPLLAPELSVVLDTDPERARATARTALARFLALPNYARNLARFGFAADDFACGGSDRLIDAVVAWGDEAAIAERVRDFHAAGADHVCLQVLADPASPALPRSQWRALASAMELGKPG